MSDDWQVGKGGETCARCEGHLAEGTPYYSALCDSQGLLVRRDFCTGCWGDAGDEGEFYCHWRTRRQPDNRPKRVDAGVIFDFFLTIGETDLPDRAEMRFVLALYLTRRKALKLGSVRREGGRSFIEFRKPRTDDVYLVEDPQMDEDKIAAATQRVKELFQSDV